MPNQDLNLSDVTSETAHLPAVVHQAGGGVTTGATVGDMEVTQYPREEKEKNSTLACERLFRTYIPKGIVVR